MGFQSSADRVSLAHSTLTSFTTFATRMTSRQTLKIKYLFRQELPKKEIRRNVAAVAEDGQLLQLLEILNQTSPLQRRTTLQRHASLQRQTTLQHRTTLQRETTLQS